MLFIYDSVIVTLSSFERNVFVSYLGEFQKSNDSKDGILLIFLLANILGKLEI